MATNSSSRPYYSTGAYQSSLVRPQQSITAQKECFTNPEAFEGMIGGLRKTFMAWLRKTEGELATETQSLEAEKAAFSDELAKMRRQIQIDKQHEGERIHEDKRRAEQDLQTQLRLLQVERDDHKQKINDERQLLESDLEKHRWTLILEKEKFKKEMNDYEEERRRVAEANIATDTKVELNVGGVIFETSRHVLMSQKGSMLEGIVSGRETSTRDRRGRLFIDRDSVCFSSILNFLRNKDDIPRVKSVLDSETLNREAALLGVKFYSHPLAYVCGGHDGTSHLTSLEVLDVDRAAWRAASHMQTGRANFGSAGMSSVGRICLFGGQNDDYRALCDCEAYDVLSDRWMKGAPLGTPRRNLGSCHTGNRALAVGGFDGDSIMSSVECYDPRSKGWEELPPLPTPRSSCMCAYLDGRVYVLGGTKGVRLRSVDVFDERGGKWVESEGGKGLHSSVDMIEVRSAGAAVVCDGCLYVIGGTDHSHAVHSSVERLDTHTRMWSFTRAMPSPLMDLGATAVDGAIMVAGGHCEDVSGGVCFYAPQSDEWQDGPNLMYARYGHQVVMLNM
eukprot:GHVR01140477.1.p1 GENE.GHVR01140477.1~~GHVR01140477.1.p1  ORF type:complete len:562 (+),score=157.13 GHVR01140477.1:1690-3375(+)